MTFQVSKTITFHIFVCLNDVMIFEEFFQFIAFKCLPKLSLAFYIRFTVERNLGSNIKSIYYIVKNLFSLLTVRHNMRMYCLLMVARSWYEIQA
jgi:hypothetical protein